MDRRDLLKVGASLALAPLALDIFVDNHSQFNVPHDISDKKYKSPYFDFKLLGIAKNIYMIRESKLGKDKKPSNINCYRYITIQYENGVEEWVGFCAGDTILNKFDIDGFFNSKIVLSSAPLKVPYRIAGYSLTPALDCNGIRYTLKSLNIFQGMNNVQFNNKFISATVVKTKEWLQQS